MHLCSVRGRVAPLCKHQHYYRLPNRSPPARWVDTRHAVGPGPMNLVQAKRKQKMREEVHCIVHTRLACNRIHLLSFVYAYH